MPKTLAVIQPSFLPWRGFFKIVAAVDTFVLYDDVQYDKHGWRNRNRIKTPAGLQWITVPVKSKGRFGQLIRDVEIDNDLPWRRKILGSVRAAYGRAPYFDKYFPWLESALDSRYIADLDETLMRDICGFLGLVTPITRSSTFALRGDDPVDRLIQLCLATRSDRYLSGPSAKSYIAPDAFVENQVSLVYEDYSDLGTYRQMSEPFDAHASILDGLMCCDVNLGLWNRIAADDRRESRVDA